MTISLQRQCERITLIRQAYGNRLEVVSASPRWPKTDIEQKGVELREIEAAERTMYWLLKNEHALRAALWGQSNERSAKDGSASAAG